jgi:hypothetical protein
MAIWLKSTRPLFIWSGLVTSGATWARESRPLKKNWLRCRGLWSKLRVAVKKDNATDCCNGLRVRQWHWVPTDLFPQGWLEGFSVSFPLVMQVEAVRTAGGHATAKARISNKSRASTIPVVA